MYVNLNIQRFLGTIFLYLPCFKRTKMLIIILPFLCNPVQSQNISLSIPLNKTLGLQDKELFGGFVTLNESSTLKVTLTYLNPNISYIIFQAHSHLYNVTVYNNSLVPSSSVVGTNVGLYSSVASKSNIFYVFNNNSMDIKLFISIHGYNTKDPIPGGCNMEYPLLISPNLHVKFNDYLIMVDAASAKAYDDKFCNAIDKVVVNFYRMYLPEKDFEEDTYFNGLKSLSTLDNIIKNGEIIPATSIMSMRRILSAYPGTGSIFVAVAFSEFGYSVYVPAYTYACSLLEVDTCRSVDGLFTQLLWVGLALVGLFICYKGHKYFYIELFVMGFITASIITYIVLLTWFSLNMSNIALIVLSILFGASFGMLWLLLWWQFGIPLLSVLLPAMNFGILYAAIIYFVLPGDFTAMLDDYNFWTLFSLLVALSSLSLLTLTFLSNILCCTVLGAYMTAYSLDHYVGSNLGYIIINVIRRATVTEFDKAVVSPPFQWKDGSVLLVWLLLAVSGFVVQHCQSDGRPAFPPPQSNTSRVRNLSVRVRRPLVTTANEITPLLS